jgi:hypothetical protein
MVAALIEIFLRVGIQEESGTAPAVAFLTSGVKATQTSLF